MSDKPDFPDKQADALRELNCRHDPVTGHVLLSFNGHAVRLVSAEQVESLLAILGKVRAEMQPPMSDTLSPDTIHATPPLDRLALVTQDDVPAVQGGAILSVRSSYFGWMSMEMRPAFCQQLASDLLGYVPLTPDVPPGTRFN